MKRTENVDSLVEVTAVFWERGMTTSTDLLECACWGGNWSDHVDKYADVDEELSCEAEEVIRFFSPAVSLSFRPIGTGREDEASSTEYLVADVGADNVFRDDYESLVAIAKEKLTGAKRPIRHQPSGCVGDVCHPDKKPEVIRFIVAYSFWSNRSYDGEYDCAIEIIGVVDLTHLHYEGEDIHDDQRRAASRRHQARRRISF